MTVVVTDKSRRAFSNSVLLLVLFFLLSANATAQAGETSSIDQLAANFNVLASIEFLISAALVATIVIPITMLATRMVLHKSSSSTRHLVWLLALVAVLIGPVLSGVETNSPFRVDANSLLVDAEPMQEPAEQQPQAGPEQRLSLNQSLDYADRAHAERSFGSPLREHGRPVDIPATTELANAADDQPAKHSPVPTPAQASATVAVRPWVFTAVLVWIVVAVGIACLAVAAQVVLFVKRQRYQQVTDPALLQMCGDVATKLGVRRGVTLLEGESNAMPMTWGVIRPVLLMPANAHEWSAERMRMVLLHELAHVRRYDCLWQTVSALAIACHWFNPLVWLAARRLHSECERACDDVVLSSGVAASNYAEQLLDISTGGRRGVLVMCAGLAMARSERLTGRLLAIVDDGRERASVSRGRLIGAVFAAALVLIPISMTARVTIAAETDESTPAAQKPAASEKPAVEKARAEQRIPPADAADPYNVLYDVIMTRHGKDGKSYAQNETSPAIFAWSEFPFDDKTFGKFNAALDAFAALPQENIDEYSDVKRALLQRHLWKVFDTTFNWDWSADWWWSGRKSFPKSHLDRRAASQPKIASLIRRLALTKAQILALPNPMAATVKSGGFAQAHDPADRFKPFLPADLYSEESSWICVGEDGDEIPASEHTSKLYSRSMFLQFMRLPGGRAETLEYMERAKKQVRQFPVGTQFALIEQPFLISNEGDLVLSPLIVSVQLRAYLNVGRRFNRFEDDPKPTQCVAEFVMQPRELMKGNAVMKAMGPNDFRYDAGAPDSVGFNPRDPFATGDISEGMPKLTRLNVCMSCHGGAGSRGVRTGSFEVTNSFLESSAEKISQATSAQKRGHKQWKALQALWQGKSLPKDDDAKMAAKAEPEKQPEDKPDKYPDNPKLRAALMTRTETEVADELKNLHTAVLHAEVAKLSEMFDLEETEISRLRLAAQGAANNAVEKTRDSLMAAVEKWVNYLLAKNDVDMTAVRVNGKYIRLDASPNDQDSDEKNPWHDSLRITVKRKVSNNWLSFGFTYGTFSNTAGPKDSDVQSEELWRKSLSAVLTKAQLAQYTEHTKSRFESTVVDMILTALQFDLDLQDSQLPVVRRRIEERINANPSGHNDIERTVGRDLQRLKAEDLADILPKEQLDQFVEHTKSSIKSTIITLILRELQFDLHLPDSQLPVVRKRLEERINPGPLNRSIDSAAMRIRWTLKAKDVADILTEPQLTLWRLTQEQH